MDKMIQPLPCGKANHFSNLPRHICLCQDPGTDRIIHIMMDIGDLIGQSDNTPFQRHGHTCCLVVQDAVPYLIGKI